MKIYLIAGEPSGDKLGAALMVGLRSLCPDVAFQGIGGPLMQAEGLHSLFDMADLSVMGLAEVVPRYAMLRRRLSTVVADVIQAAPDALITIDSPDFCLRVSAGVKSRMPVAMRPAFIHYVAPSVWAWRPKRAQRMARVIDHVLALLPFEPPFMTGAGMSCDFVGHPVVAEPRANIAAAQEFRASHGIALDAPLVMALPGSRRGEVTRLSPRFGQTLAQVAERVPQMRVVVPRVLAQAGLVAELCRDWPGQPVLLDPNDAWAKRAAFAAADVALAASGTVSLELAANDVPMVIGYDMAWLSRQIMARMIRVPSVTLVNLVSQTTAVPEFIGAACRPGPMADALMAVLPGGEGRGAQLRAMALTMERLGRGGPPPGLRAAQSVLRYLAKRG